MSELLATAGSPGTTVSRLQSVERRDSQPVVPPEPEREVGPAVPRVGCRGPPSSVGRRVLLSHPLRLIVDGGNVSARWSRGSGHLSSCLLRLGGYKRMNWFFRS